MEDQTSPEQLRDAFRGIANDKVSVTNEIGNRTEVESLQPFVTELDLRVALLPADSVEYLRQAMPPAPNDGEGLDYEAWLDEVFA